MAKTGSKHTNIDSVTDKELVTRSLANNNEAFAALVMRHKDNLINFISGYIHIKEDTEDIMQESFKRAFNSLDKYDDKYAFTTWLYNIAKNAAIDHLRRNKNNLASSGIEVEGEMMINAPIIDDSPEDNLIMNQTVEEILYNIDKLSPRYKKIAELRFIHEYAYEEIANELDLPINTVRTRIKRAKEQLQSIIKDK